MNSEIMKNYLKVIKNFKKRKKMEVIKNLIHKILTTYDKKQCNLVINL